MKITQIPMGTHNAQLTCYLQDPCTEMLLWIAALRS